ncbi:MAG: amidohydrolase family protein [Bacteroidales bacterium]|nr:amidohydrolase family protein [Bacteroidales bacterium]
MICDAHVHVGQFRELYTSPNDIVNFFESLCVDKYAVSSTSTCMPSEKANPIEEMKELSGLAGNKLVPVLWVVRRMLANSTLKESVECGVNWRCLKIHGYFEQWEEDEIEYVIDVARELRLPLLFHTGGRPESDSESYLDIIKRNQDVTCIIAHSRPIDQALKVLEECPNCYADTAFTPAECISELIINGFEDRVLFGTDYPLHDYFYPGQDMSALYRKIILDTQSVMSEQQWDKVSHVNFEKLFL